MTGGSTQVADRGWFTQPEEVNHRRYEALRAFFVDGLTHAEAAQRSVPWWGNRTLRYELA